MTHYVDPTGLAYKYMLMENQVARFKIHRTWDEAIKIKRDGDTIVLLPEEILEKLKLRHKEYLQTKKGLKNASPIDHP